MKKTFWINSILFIGLLLVVSGNANAQDIIQDKAVSSNKQWKITFSHNIIFDNNIKDNIIVKDKEGRIVNVIFALGEDNKSVYVKPPKSGYIPLGEYELIIGKNIKSTSGRKMKKSQSCRFRIKDKVVPTDILIKETNLPPISTGQGDVENNELWLKYSNGEEKLLVSSREKEDMRYVIAGISNPEFTLDKKSVYFISEAWAVSGAIHKVDIATGKENFICDGNYFEVIQSGKYKGKLLVIKHNYRGYPQYGSYEGISVVDENGNEMLSLGEEFDRELFYKLQDEVDDVEHAKEVLYSLTNEDREMSDMRYMPDSSYVDGRKDTDEIRKKYFVFSLDNFDDNGDAYTADFSLLVKKDNFEVYIYEPDGTIKKWINY